MPGEYILRAQENAILIPPDQVGNNRCIKVHRETGGVEALARKGLDHDLVGIVVSLNSSGNRVGIVNAVVGYDSEAVPPGAGFVTSVLRSEVEARVNPEVLGE